MKISSRKDNDRLTLVVEGRIDSSTAPEFESIVKREIRDCVELVFDFRNLEYISSAGLRILLGARKFIGSQEGMKVINVNETVYEIFEVTGFSLLLDIDRI